MRALRNPFIVVSLLFIFGLSAYGAYIYTKSGLASIEPSAGGQPEAMPVQVVNVAPEKIQIWKSFSGNVVAVDRADIRPQVSGRITEIKFEDGQTVEKGDILIVIDPRPYEAALNQAKASLAAAKTQAELAEKELNRAKELIKTDAVSQRLLDERSHAFDRTKAAVQEAKAREEQAEINLDYAYVKAPISGKTSRAELTEGNLVQAGPNAPLLTSIVADEQLYVDFEIDDQTYMRSIRGYSDSEAKITVRLSLLDGDIKYQGHVHSFDNAIDPTTGTIRVRSLFDNDGHILLPGMTVTCADMARSVSVNKVVGRVSGMGLLALQRAGEHVGLALYKAKRGGIGERVFSKSELFAVQFHRVAIQAWHGRCAVNKRRICPT